MGIFLSTQRIVDEKNRIVIAEGRMTLLEHIVATGSINQAAKQMRMSYKSAWSKIRSTEAHLKTKIVHSDKSRGTRLTEAGRELLRKYRQLKQQCLTADDAVFKAIFNPPALQPVVNPDGRFPAVVSFDHHRRIQARPLSQSGSVPARSHRRHHARMPGRFPVDCNHFRYTDG